MENRAGHRISWPPKNSPGSSRLLAEAPSHFGEQWIFAGLLADTQVTAIGLRGAAAFQALADASLEVVQSGEVAISRDIVHKKLDRFAAAFETALEFGVGFGECPRFEVGLAKIEAAEPRVQQLVGFTELSDRLAGIALLQGCFAGDQLGVSLGLNLQLSRQAVG